MNEKSDKARWDMCKQCLILPGPYRLLAGDNPEIVDFIECNRDKKWCNPIRNVMVPCLPYLNPTYLCNGCRFRMEHLVLGQRKLDNE